MLLTPEGWRRRVAAVPEPCPERVGLHPGGHPMLPHARRQRGITLIEGVLYLTLAGGLLAFTGQLLFDEARRREEIIAAADFKLVLEAAQRHVAAKSDSLRVELFNATTTSGQPLVAAFDLTRLRDSGHLAAAYLNAPGGMTARNTFGQDYALLVRGVDRADKSAPQATLRRTDVDRDGDGAIDATMVDKIASATNPEFDLEALLITNGGEAVPANRGNRVTVLTGLTSAGHVREAGTADGPFAAWQLDLAPYAGLPSAPEQGRFAGLVSLSGFGPVDVPLAADALNEFLSRCAGIADPTSAASALCESLAAQRAGRVFSDIVMTPYDGDDDGTIDTVPRLVAGSINMALADTTGDGRPDLGALDTDGDGVDDLSSEIVNLSEIACAGSTTGFVAAGTLLVECATVSLAGALEVAGEATVAGDLVLGPGAGTRLRGGADLGTPAAPLAGAVLEGALQVGRLLLDENADGIADLDLSEGFRVAGLYAHGSTIPKPACPATRRDGAAMAPRVYVIPVAWSDPEGVPIVGVHAAAVDAGAAGWTVEFSRFRATDADADGIADQEPVQAAEGRVLGLVRCY